MTDIDYAIESMLYQLELVVSSHAAESVKDFAAHEAINYVRLVGHIALETLNPRWAEEDRRAKRFKTIGPTPSESTT